MKKITLIIFAFISLNTTAQTWSAVGSGLNGDVRGGGLTIYNDTLIAGGLFNTLNGNPDNGEFISKWDGTSWSPLGTGLNDWVEAVLPYNGNLYVGGRFSTAGGTTAYRIAKWDGSTWSALGSGLNGTDGVKTLCVYNGFIYAGGDFSQSGATLNINSIAKWDGTAWSPLGTGVTGGEVITLAVYAGELYAAGYFSSAGGISVNNIAKWNGTSWSAVGSGTNGNIEALAVYKGELYVGGSFSTAGGITANGIAKWNGTSWSAVGTGVLGSGTPGVTAFSIYNSELYVGGSFLVAGGIDANNIVKWNGTTWSALGIGTDGFIAAFTVYNSELYAGGRFSHAAGISVHNIAKWSSPPNCTGFTITYTQSPIVCLGNSVTVGTHTYTNSGTYIDTLTAANTCDSIVTTKLTVLTTRCTTAIAINNLEANISVYPNPSNGIINIQTGQFENVQIKIYDVLGKSVYQNNTSSNLQIDLSNQPNGVYFISIKTNEGAINKKIVINH